MKIGCSGWIYPDWNISFYRKGEKDRLKYYSSIFNAVEVNSTFYSPLPRATLLKWARTMKGNSFSFSVKVPGSITHDNLIGRTGQACSDMLKFQESHLDYLSGEGLLGAVLFQLPPYFKMEHLDKLLQVISSFDHHKFTCFVEPRHRELYGNVEFSRALSGEGIGMASVDSPELELRQNMHQGNGRQYLRFHGRNREQWYRKGAGKLEKYDYLYSRNELESFVRIISPLASRGDEIFIFFNNHPSGKAPANAAQMMEMFGMRPHTANQNTLF